MGHTNKPTDTQRLREIIHETEKRAERSLNGREKTVDREKENWAKKGEERGRSDKTKTLAKRRKERDTHIVKLKDRQVVCQRITKGTSV